MPSLHQAFQNPIQTLPKTKTAADRTTATYTYNATGRLIESEVGGELIEMGYTKAGHKLFEESGIMRVVYNYDALGRFIQASEPGDVVKTSTHIVIRGNAK